MKIIKDIKNWFEMYPPEIGTSKEWKNFNNKCKEHYPIRYWINETLIPNVWWPVPRFFDSIRNWIRFRFFERMHIIKTNLKPDYYDCDTRILHGMFNLLVDFVEIEKAWMEVICNNNYKKSWFSFKRFRNRELGLLYLDWEITLTDENSSQAEAAKEIKELYLWWTEERPSRLDPYDLLRDEDFSRKTSIWDRLEDTSDETRKIYKEIDELEKEYNDEDTEMLIKLIKLRGSLWT